MTFVPGVSTNLTIHPVSRVKLRKTTMLLANVKTELIS